MTNTASDMPLKRSVIFTLLFFLFFTTLFAQKKEPLHKKQIILKEDAQKDTLRIYRKIKYFAYKHKITTQIYKLIFIDPEPKEYPKQPASKEEKNVNPYLKYKGKIIRNINITVYDPFGHSVADTLEHATNGAQRFGNRLHIKTQQWVINNRLLFKRNDSLNALRLSETERILRTAVFVNDARITVMPAQNKDSVDVNVIVLDKWPITVPVFASPTSAHLRIRNMDLLGLGQQFEQYVGFRKPNVFDFNGYYTIANLDNTYISAQLAYATDITGTQVSLGFNRAFFSPLTKWAGGVNITRSWRYYNYTDSTDNAAKKVSLNYIAYDVWAGRSFKLSNSKSLFNQSTNIITGLHLYNTTFIERPPFTIDVAKGNQNISAIVGNVGFAVQQYYKDKYIYRFGANEDVPEGLIVQYIYGGYKKELEKFRYYSGVQISRAKHFNFGYLSATFSEGIFFNKHVSNDITTNFRIYYFSDLKRNGRWYFRQFFYYNLVHGENKISRETTTFTTDELFGFNSAGLAGKTKMLVNSQTVAYMPYNIIGFRLAPVFMAGAGMIGDPADRIYKSRLYQGYSIGLLVRNESLLSSTFQVSFGFYPFLPDGHRNVFVTNPVTSFTIRVTVFAVGRPDFVSY